MLGKLEKSIIFISLTALLASCIILCIDYPSGDVSRIISLISKYHNGELGLVDFFEQHDANRHFVPNVIVFGIGLLTDFNFKVISFVNLALLFAGLMLLINHYDNKWSRILAIISVLGFTNYVILQDSWHIVFILNFVLLITMLKIEIFSESKYKNLAVISVCFTASFVSIHGLFLWIIALFAKLMNKRSFSEIVLFLIFAGLTLALYFYSFNPNKTLINGESNLYDKTLYAIAYAGGGITQYKAEIALFFGSLMLTTAGVAFLKNIGTGFSRKEIFFFSLFVFAGICMAGTAYGRAHLGLEHATSTHYSLYSTIFFISFLGLVESYSKNKKTFNYTIIFFGVFLMLNWSNGLIRMYQQNEILTGHRDSIIANYPTLTEEDLRNFIWVDPMAERHRVFARKQLSILAEHKYSFFGEDKN